MGQGIYRMIGFGVLDPPDFDWDAKGISIHLYDSVCTRYECEQDYIAIPFGVDEGCLRKWWGLRDLPKGLPHVKDRTAVRVKDAEVSRDGTGVIVPNHIRSLWEAYRVFAAREGLTLGEGYPIFISDWD